MVVAQEGGGHPVEREGAQQMRFWLGLPKLSYVARMRWHTPRRPARSRDLDALGAALELEDIDWRAGELVVRGKAGRQDRLPLPHCVGGAIADYLRGERPDTASRRVFITAIAPRTAISTKTIGVVRCACRRCGVASVGPRLRHLAGLGPVTKRTRGGRPFPRPRSR